MTKHNEHDDSNTGTNTNTWTGHGKETNKTARGKREADITSSLLTMGKS